MQQPFSFLLCVSLFLASCFAQAQGASSSQWELIKHIGETSLYIPADKVAQLHPNNAAWRTFRIMMNDTDIAPNSIVMTVTIDCEHKSMRTDLFELYDEIDGGGSIIQSTPSKTDEFIPMNEALAPAGAAYEAFCKSPLS
ncbi:MAG: surface-adhesin E family protein [Saezia sp.]